MHAVGCPKCGKLNEIEFLNDYWLAKECVYCYYTFEFKYSFSEWITRSDPDY